MSWVSVLTASVMGPASRVRVSPVRALMKFLLALAHRLDMSSLRCFLLGVKGVCLFVFVHKMDKILSSLSHILPLSLKSVCLFS